MRQDLHLFIGGKEVEFNNDPKILFNFKETDLENPTNVKNSWTKTITINSTPANDDIFTHFWNLERTQGGGINFNAMVKTPFELYINNALIQNGYAKLDNVKMSNNSIQYQISLYGGLGDFFYNLSYVQGSVGDEKKTLASLIYINSEISTEPELDFTINRDTIKAAWDTITETGTQLDKWKVINFAPVYNGIPDDFDADKVLINNRGSAGIFHKNEGGYQPIYNGSKNVSGYSLGEMTEELTADETFDFRSYLQRPVVNVKRVIEACCHPANNGGYQVKLDTHFFDNGGPNTENPYWTKAWCTLPMLRDLEVEGGESTEITGATIQNTSKNRKNVVFGTSSLSQIDNVRLRINVGLNTSEITGSPSTLYTHYHFDSPAHTTNTDYVRNYDYNGAALFMLVGRDVNGVICAQSDAYCLSSYAYNQYGNPIGDGFSVEGYPAPKNIRYVEGVWKKSGTKWRFCNRQGQQVDIEFTFPGAAPIASLEIATQTNAGEKVVYKVWGNEFKDNTPNISFVLAWPQEYVSENTLKTYAQVIAPRNMTHFTYDITDFYAIATDFEALFSDTYIPKSKLLSTSYTPADFLISYCKMFGLYFYRDPAELADDPTSCPQGVIHIMDRDTFYKDEYVDLQDAIDRSKTMTITPTMAASKWYRFEQEPIESEAGNAYKKTYGYNYGRQLVNTGYDFDNNTTDLYKGNVFKSGVMVREKDKYFAMPINGAPVYAYNGFKYSLFDIGEDGYDSVELEINKRIYNKTDINTLNLKGYDAMPKLQCHTEKNSASDGDGVLLFYKGYVQTPNDYWLTDDVLEMQTINGGNACWLMPNAGIDAAGNSIAIKTNILPHFSRDLVNFGLQEGNIVNSWNFGQPQVIFSPNTYTTENDNIYSKCWKSFIGDMFSVDGKSLNCYVNFKGVPSADWLRKWYWFDNSIWRLNEIKDWNAADENTTNCTFIKVQDINNYKLAKITSVGNEMIILNSNTIGYSGGTIGGRIILQSGGNWFTEGGRIYGTDIFGNEYYIDNAIRPNTGHGETTNISVVIPQSSAIGEITWRVCFEDDHDSPLICATIVQDGDTSPYLAFTESSIDKTAEATNITAHFTKRNVQTGLTASVDYDGQVQTGWVSNVVVDEMNGVITADLSANMLFARHAYIVLSGVGTNGDPVQARVQVSQSSGGAADLSVQPDTLTFEYYDTSSTTKIVNITYGGNWTITEQ